MKALTYIEIDVDYCDNVYGSSPCTAAIGVTGDIKCFNTIKTCQDRVNFVNSPATLRFSLEGRDYQPVTIEAIPCVIGLTMTPGQVSLGENLGVRSSVNITFRDFKHSDTGAGGDPYLSDRTYDPYTQGTFFGKFRSRQPFLQGRPLRVYQGELGQALGDMVERHYVIEQFTGPTAGGLYQIIAKDALKLADDDRAQAPRISTGRLSGSLTDVATSATLTPSGIGDEEYPASGYVCIGGREVCSFTRSSDTLTLTRGQLNTTAIAHQADDRVQLVLSYVAQDPADIVYDLMSDYAGIDTDFLPRASWKSETSAYLNRLYTAYITEPTGVNKLCSELIQQAALAMWWDDASQLIRLQVLRGVASDVDVFDAGDNVPEGNVIEGSLVVKEQPAKRISEVWTYFDRRDPTRSITELENYRSIAVTVDLQRSSDYGSAAIKKITSRWIPSGGRSIALRLNDIMLARFADPPRLFELELFRTTLVAVGGGYQVGGWPLQDATGAQERVPAQCVRLDPRDDKNVVALEEVLFDLDPEDLDSRVVIVDTDRRDFNLRDAHDLLYPEIVTVGSITLLCIVETSVVIGSTDPATPAFDVGTFPVGLPIEVRVRGRIQGAGGRGGDVGATATNGQDGGTALYTRQAIDLILDDGDAEIWGGGGGGGTAYVNFGVLVGAGGGGGAGDAAGSGGNSGSGGIGGSAGTDTAGGAGGVSGSILGGTGGGPATAGINGSGGSATTTPGAAGKAIDGVSYVTKTGTGDILGVEVN